VSYIHDQLAAGDFEQITVSSTAVGPTASKLSVTRASGRTSRAVRIFLTVETQAVRIRFDGSDPTAAIGHTLAVGDYMTIDGEANCSNLKMIRITSDATVNITYFYTR
jgi:hypothetical protein